MINEAKTKITAPISIEDVRQVLTAGDRDLASLCTHPNINIWARCKPVINASLKNRGTASGIKAVFGASANPYTASLSAFTHDAPYGTMQSPYRLSDFDGYKHNASAPVYGIYYNAYKGEVTLYLRQDSQTLDAEQLSLGDAVSAYDSLLSGDAVDENLPDTSGWYLCVVFLATSDATKLALAFAEKSKGDKSERVTKSTRAGGAPVEGDVSEGDDDVNLDLSAQTKDWNFSDDDTTGTYNLSKIGLGAEQDLTYYLWATASTPLNLCTQSSITINAKNIQDKWGSIDANNKCPYHLGFVCLVNQQFDKNATYDEGDVMFLPIPTAKVRDAYFYKSDNVSLDTLVGTGSGFIIDGEIAEI